MKSGMPTVLLVVLTLAACGEETIRATASSAYADGYRDGCKNGSSNASNLTGVGVKDEKRYLADPEYASGWRNGNRTCDGQNLIVNPTNPMEQVDIDGPTYFPSD